MKKLNLGCGRDYRPGWINLDFNRSVKADVYADLNKKLPFKDNEIDYILLDNVLEHVTREKYFKFIEELHRICKNGAIIDIFVPHYSGMYALKHPTHYIYFGVGSFDTFKPQQGFNGERYSSARFNVLKEKLLFFHHNLANMKFLSRLPINWLFNFSSLWRQLMEKFHIFGFDEIYFRLKVVKNLK